MSKKPLNISEEAAVQMPMKTVASLIIIVALGTMGYFQIIERLNVADTRIQIMEKDLEENTEFRIKWPRGQLGSLPADSEQFMMIEDLYKTTDKLNKHIESMALNKVNIEFLRKQIAIEGCKRASLISPFTNISNPITASIIVRYRFCNAYLSLCLLMTQYQLKLYPFVSLKILY